MKIKLTKEYILLDGYLDTGNISSYNEYPIVFLDKKYYDLNLKVYSVTQIKTINGLEYINCYKPKEFFIFDNNKLISKEVLVSFSNFNNNINCLLNNLMFS